MIGMDDSIWFMIMSLVMILLGIIDYMIRRKGWARNGKGDIVVVRIE